MDQVQTPRARSVEEFGAMMMRLSQFELEHFRPLEPQPGDVFITSWAKSGTTLTQQMFHQLRTGGDMDFDDISRMTPWEDSAVITDLDMNIAQRASPRGFKSHREYERLPAGCRYVVTLRDPVETYISLHRFFSGRGRRTRGDLARGFLSAMAGRRARWLRLFHPSAQLVCAPR